MRGNIDRAFLGLMSILYLSVSLLSFPAACQKKSEDVASSPPPRDSSFSDNSIHDAGVVADASPPGQTSRQGIEGIQLSLAKICVSEAGFQVRTNDCTLIYHALRTRSKTGDVTMGIMRAYSRKTFDETRDDNHRWILHLNPELTEPLGWSDLVTVPWSARKSGFSQVYNHAGSLLRSRPKNPCGMRIDHWGARGFRRNLHMSNGWSLIECGETLNDFWSLPEPKSDDEPMETEMVAEPD